MKRRCSSLRSAAAAAAVERLPSTCMTGTRWRISASIARQLPFSSAEQKAIARPWAPARAVRPMRWT